MGLFLGIILFLTAILPQKQIAHEPLHDLLQRIEAYSGYRFLYQDALVAGKSVNLVISDNWQADLLNELEKWNLDARVDSERRQVIIFRNRTSFIRKTGLSGEIIDKKSGEKLPFATVTLESQSGELQGTQTDLYGRFTISLPESEGEIILKVSYIGYEDYELKLNHESIDSPDQINIRISPSSYQISEIIVTGSGSSGSAGEIYRGMLEAGTFSPAGESNSIRMLQLLPAVQNGSSMVDGAHVRGSNSDAFHVLLDGTVIYNRSHLFGLIDSFNSDIIRTGSFYYDVAPARFHAPPGGVLSLVTKTGSLHEYAGTLGLSSSVVRGSLEGPIIQGKSSFLIAARQSIIDQVNIFDTDGMIAWGLDANRPSSLSENTDLLTDRISRPLDSSVNFHDLHGKVMFEGSENNRWVFSGYAGGDITKQETERLVRTGFNSPGNRFELQNFNTENNWGNRSFNISNYRQFGDRDGNLHVEGGYSYYYTGFLKEDFVYQRPGLNENEQLLFVDEFENESELNHSFISGEFDKSGLKTGFTLNFFNSAYLENSLNRPEFYQESNSVMPEAYLDFEKESGEVAINAGIRLQYFSDGKYANISPRLKFSIFNDHRISAGLGYSRNFQYLYRLSIYSLSTADIWITAVPGQAPSKSDIISGSIYAKLWSGAGIQAEGYLKWQEKLRYHEINIQNLDISLEDRPWFSDNDGYARGVELLIRQVFPFAELSQSYTYSVSEMRNTRLNNGDWFFTEWDRRHQLKSLLKVMPVTDLAITFSWSHLSGAPDRLTLFREIPERLGIYSRLDLGLAYSRDFSGTSIELRGSVYNLTNRNNPWYREWVQTINDEGVRSRLQPVQADVYDLGVQPSFSVRIGL
jgi:hypothetical protein